MEGTDKIVKLIIDGLGEIKTLKIKTIVGKFTDAEGKIIEDGTAKVIITRIDLLEGDITTAFSDDFLKPPYDKIREYHLEKEQQGREIIKSNIEVLKEILKLIDDLKNWKP